MKKLRFIVIFALALSCLAAVAHAQAADRLKGRILLQVESKGQAWYVDPISGQRAFLGYPADAFRVMREMGLGITNKDLARIALPDEVYSYASNKAVAQRLAGRILLQVENKGAAWYINPVDLKRYSLGYPADAFQVMRQLGLGISNIDLAKIAILSNYPETFPKPVVVVTPPVVTPPYTPAPPIVVVPPVTVNGSAGTMDVSQAGSPSAQTYVIGNQGIDMLGLNLSAGPMNDLTVTSLRVYLTGDSSCQEVGNCVLNLRLYDGNVQISQISSIASGGVTFSNLKLKVAKGTTKTVVVKADLNNFAVFSQSHLTLKLNNVASDLVIVDNNSNSVAAKGSVAGLTQTINSTGIAQPNNNSYNSNVYLGSDSRLVIAGTNDVTVARFNFNALYEDLKLSRLRIKVRGTNPADGAIREVAGIALWDDLTNTMIADYSTPNQATDNAGVTWAVVDFNSMANDFVVPRGGARVLSVRATLNTISGGARSGSSLTFSIDGYATKFDGTAGSNNLGPDYEFRGVNGSNTVDHSAAADINGNTMYLYRSIPTITTPVLPSSILSGGEQTIGRVVISADAKGNIDWTKLVFTVNGSAFGPSGVISSARLVDESGSTVQNLSVSLSSGLTTPAADLSGTISVASSVDQNIPAGVTRTYSLKATIAGAQAGSTLSTYLAAPSAFTSPATQTAAAATSASVVWSDEAASPHGYSNSADYMNEFKIKIIPTDSQTLAK